MMKEMNALGLKDIAELWQRELWYCESRSGMTTESFQLVQHIQKCSQTVVRCEGGVQGVC